MPQFPIMDLSERIVENDPCSNVDCVLGYGHSGAHSNYGENVNHPRHYNEHPSGVECIDVVEWFNFNIGNAIKYLWRMGLKPGVSELEDLRKASWYIEREIARIEKTQTEGS